MSPQTEFQIYMKAASSKFADAANRHLSAEEVIAFYQGQLPTPESEKHKEHLTHCPACLQLWRDARDFCAPPQAFAASEAEAGEFELRREWKELWGRIQADPQTVTTNPSQTVARGSGFTPRTALAMAAGIALAVSLTAVTLFWRQERQQRIEAQVAAARTEKSHQESLARINQLEQSGKAHLKTKEQLKLEQQKNQELQTRLDEFNQPQTGTPIYDLMLSGKQRSAGQNEDVSEISVPASTKSYVLKITPDIPGDFSGYVIEIFDGQNRPKWKSNKLKLDQSGELTVTFPRTFLNEGRYLIQVYGGKKEASKLVGEYHLKLTLSRK